MSKTFVLVKDYGSHAVVDSINPDERLVRYDLANLINSYREKGYVVDHLMSGDATVRKQLGSKGSALSGLRDGGKDVIVPSWQVIALRIERRNV